MEYIERLRIIVGYCLTIVALQLSVLGLLGVANTSSGPSAPFSLRVAGGDDIPKATKPCSPEVAQWWEELRKAGRVAADATARKEEAIKRAVTRKRERHERVPDDESEILPADELSRLNETIKVSKEKYLNLIRLAAEKSYPVPLDDGRVVILHFNEPQVHAGGASVTDHGHGQDPRAVQG
jgi:hypothetical protein